MTTTTKRKPNRHPGRRSKLEGEVHSLRSEVKLQRDLLEKLSGNVDLVLSLLREGVDMREAQGRKIEALAGRVTRIEALAPRVESLETVVQKLTDARAHDDATVELERQG